MPAGFPTVDGSIAAMSAMVEAGVDVVEVGLPYSDPVMDGPVIQRASDIALAGGVRTADALRDRRGGGRRRRAGGRDDVLEPDRAVRRRARSPATWPRPAAPG